MNERKGGATLVELLVALALTAVVSAGLAAFMASGFRAIVRVGGALAAQSALRRAAADLEDDVREAGFFVPCRPAPGGHGLVLRRDLPVRGVAGAVLRTDELELRKDLVLPARARLAEGILADDPAAAGRRLCLAVESRVRLEAGDLIVAEDGRWEAWRIQAGEALAPGGSANLPVEPLEQGPSRSHEAGTPLALVRPDRLVCYRLEAGPGGRPALVRRVGGEREARVVAERVEQFRVDLVPPQVRISLKASGRGLPAPRPLVVVASPRTPRAEP